MRGAAIDAAVWAAVCGWTAATNPSGLPSFAATEMLANSRRILTRRHKHIYGFHDVSQEARERRREWHSAGAPGLVPAFEHTIRYLNTIRN